MPSQMLKFTAIFQSDTGYGWTETHYRLVDSTTPNLFQQLGNFNANLLVPRAALLGQNCQIVGSRVSYKVPGAIRSYSSKFFFQGEAQSPTSSQNDSLAIVMVDSTNTRKKIIHLRGFWKAVISNEAYHPELGAALNWQQRMDDYTGALKNTPYGWPSKDLALSSSGNVVLYAANGGYITFTVANAPLPDAAVGQIKSIKFSKINHSNSPLNTTLLCEVVNNTTLKTVQQVAAGPFASMGRYIYREPSFAAYNAVGSISLGERRMGKVLGRYPGRSKAKARY